MLALLMVPWMAWAWTVASPLAILESAPYDWTLHELWK